jgi:ADP-dependent NAD(P)H-hydrate dehydratase
MTDPLPAITPARLSQVFAPRAREANKGTFGTVAIVGGTAGMTGAALLAGRSALRVGVGKVFIGFMQDTLPWPCDPLQPELMCRTANDLLEHDPGVTVWVAGSGAGTCSASRTLLSRLLLHAAALNVQDNTRPVVLDADALNLLGEGTLTLPNPAATVLTPHPGEAGRLLGQPTSQIQADRPAAIRALARRYGAWVVLKGADTLVADPAAIEVTCNSTGNVGLATAGTGDVLAGVLGSLLAQRLPWRQAIEGAVWLHGAAADRCVQQGIGPIGLTASELADQLRALRNLGVKRHE